MPNFKIYDSRQMSLFANHINDFLPKDHICFVIKEIVKTLDVSSIEEKYFNSNGGAPAYNPKTMIQILFYAYIRGMHSSRKIEQQLDENIAFRVLADSHRIDHSTINAFRKKYLIDVEKIFAQIILLCTSLKMINVKDISIDGTKYKASASKKNIYNKEQLQKIREKVRKILEEAERIDEEENKKYNNENPFKKEIPEELIDKTKRKEQIEKCKKKLIKLEKTEEIIDEKQNNAKTKEDKNLAKNKSINLIDKDANLMKMKDGSFFSAYNTGIATSKQVILAYNITDNSADTNNFIELIKKTEKNTNEKVEKVKADAGYSSQKNLDYCKKERIDAYIPNKEDAQNKSKKEKPESSKYAREKFKYNKEKDEFICPRGKRLLYRKTDRNARIYECKECLKCPHKKLCTKSKKARSISFNFKLERKKN